MRHLKARKNKRSTVMHGQSRPAETVLPGSVSLGSFNSTESFAGEEDVYGSVEEKMGSPAYLSTDVCLGQFQGHLGISNCFFQFFLPRVPQRSRTGATVAQPQGFEPDCAGRASSTLIRFCDPDVQIYSKGIYSPGSPGTQKERPHENP